MLGHAAEESAPSEKFWVMTMTRRRWFRPLCENATLATMKADSMRRKTRPPAYSRCFAPTCLKISFAIQRTPAKTLGECEYQFRSRAAVGDLLIRLDGLFKWHGLDWKSFQRPSFKAGAQLVGQRRHVACGEFHAVHADQSREIVIEINQIETHAPLAYAFDHDSAPTE